MHVKLIVCAWLLAMAPLAVQADEPKLVELPQGEHVGLALVSALSSRDTQIGQLVPLQTMEDLRVGDALLIPKGTAAMGQVTEAHSTGGLGVSGKLVVRPLYLRLGDRTVRLEGEIADKASVGAAGVLGLMITPVVSGRTVTLPAGHVLSAKVARSVQLPALQP